MLIAVGTTNPIKIKATKDVFLHYFKDAEVVGIPVSSGVAEQPKNDTETYRGALNRAQKAQKKLKADYGVGIEGGIDESSIGAIEHTVVVLVDKEGRIGFGISAGLPLPPKVHSLIKQGKNLEEAVDSLFGTKEVGESIGFFGLATKELVTRESGTEDAIAFALSRFLHENLYE